jgi:NAD(P) transhydrogenase subunit alpha
MSDTLEVSLFVFMLASFLGYTVITRVPGLLHTPLMSLTNALSAISIVGSMILAGAGEEAFATVLAPWPCSPPPPTSSPASSSPTGC